MKMQLVLGLLLALALIAMEMGCTGAPPSGSGARAGASHPVTIAMCQIVCLDNDREGNFVRIENALIKARAARADIACFPETALLGWVNPEAHTRSHPIPGHDSERLCQLARKYRLYLCIGLAEKQDDRLYDAAILIDNRGELILKHRKINTLAHLMTPPYTPGDAVQAVDTEFGRIGILICADTFHGPTLERMAAEKPELLLVPYGWAAQEDQWPEHGKALEATVTHAAQTVGCPLIGTDLVGAISHGPWTGMIYGGQSVAVDPNGNTLARGCDRDSDLQIVTLTRRR